MGVATIRKKKQTKEAQLIKLDLACGQTKQQGFIGVDNCQLNGVDVVHDLLKYPWPWKDDSVDEIYCSHFFEHIPGLQRPRFMEELYRVMKVGNYEQDAMGRWIPQNVGPKATFIMPYWNNLRAIQDFSHAWPPISEMSFLYFNKAWRESNLLTHGVYNIKCDFDFLYHYAIGYPWNQKAEETRSFACSHYTNVINDVQVALVKRPKDLK